MGISCQSQAENPLKRGSYGCSDFRGHLSSDQSVYGEQLIQLDSEDIDCSGCSNVTSDSFDYTQALSGTYKKGTGQSIVWNVDPTDSVYFEGCTIGPDKPGLDFQVIQ